MASAYRSQHKRLSRHHAKQAHHATIRANKAGRSDTRKNLIAAGANLPAKGTQHHSRVHHATGHPRGHHKKV